MTAEGRAGRDARSLGALFLESASRWPDRAALSFEDGDITYAKLAGRAQAVAAALEPPAAGEAMPVAILARRSITAFAGILGALIRGAAYLPLDPSRASHRNRAILERVGCRSFVVDAEGATALPDLLGDELPARVLLPEVSGAEARGVATAGAGSLELLGRDDLGPAPGLAAAPVESDAMAYLLFTSGSTGVPKGVMVSQANALHLVRMAAERFGVTPEDRLSHNFALTFDLSVFDMFVAWSSGACLCCPTQRELLRPDRYLARAALSMWFSVPSVAVLMNRLRLLRPGSFDGLRWSLFCGEALPASLAEAWAASAPGAALENLYGPTEATVFCTGYRWDPERSPAESERGVVPIGEALPGVDIRVVDEDGVPVAAGETGELWIGGAQVALGYWRAPEITERAFVERPEAEGGGRFYRTGDRVRLASEGPLQFLGRTDHQVKIRGHRVELGEIEAALRRATGVEQAVALPLRVTEVGAEHVAGLVAAESIDAGRIREELTRWLPSYMVPREILAIPTFPENDNGKVDRGALAELLEKQLQAGRGAR